MIRDFYQTKSPPVGRSYSWVCHCPKDEANSWDEPQQGICRLLSPERRALAAPSQSVVSFKHQTRHGQGGGNPGQVLRQPGGWVSGKTELQTGQRHRLPWRPPQLFRRSWAGTATPSQSFSTVLVGTFPIWFTSITNNAIEIDWWLHIEDLTPSIKQSLHLRTANPCGRASNIPSLFAALNFMK